MFESTAHLAEPARESAQAILVAEPKSRALAECLRSAFTCLDLGLEPHRTGFGESDFYTCPGCASRMDVRGSAYIRRVIDDPEMTHNPGCVLLELKMLSDAL